jgi:hypothetical protein
MGEFSNFEPPYMCHQSGCLWVVSVESLDKVWSMYIITGCLAIMHM